MLYASAAKFLIKIGSLLNQKRIEQYITEGGHIPQHRHQISLRIDSIIMYGAAVNKAHRSVVHCCAVMVCIELDGLVE